MSNVYSYRLDEEYKKLYLDKLEYNGISLPDPLDNELRLHLYKPLSENSVPDLTFGDIYMFLVETAQVYSREEFKNFKTLSCYKTALTGKVQDILVYQCNTTEVCVLTCDVQGDEGVVMLYRTWVVVTLNGVIQNAHCTCMNEYIKGFYRLIKGCPHIAALLLSLEIYIKKDILHRRSSFETSTEKNAWYMEMFDSKCSENKNSSMKGNSSLNTTISTDYKERLKAIKKIAPYAPIFTLLCESDTSSSEEDDFEIEESQSGHEVLQNLQKS